MKTSKHQRGKQRCCSLCWNLPDRAQSFVYCGRFEPRSHFKSRLSLIVRVNVVLNRTVVVDSD